MKVVLAWVVCLCAACAVCAANPAPSALSSGPSSAPADAAFAKAFVCPDPAAPMAERKAELRKFMDWVGKHHGDWTLAHVIAFRMGLLEAHHCTATLDVIHANEAAASAKQAAALRARAEAGDAGAQNALGLMYLQGRGVPRDFAKAFQWSHKAAERGNVAAQARVCFAYAAGKGVAHDSAKAFHWCTRAADRNSAVAEYGLALMYERGDGVPRDMHQAVAWYRKAAAQGFAPAEFNLGMLYLQGNGVPRDDARGVALYREAAEHGDASAQGNLAFLYMTGGGGLAKDYTEAIKWATLAANRGNPSAQNTLGTLYSNGQGVPRDAVTAAKWFMLVRGAGEIEAACNLGKLEARMVPAQIASARSAAQAWQVQHGMTDTSTNASRRPSACPTIGNHYGVAAFTTGRAGRDAAAHLLDTWYGDVPLSEVAARGFAPDTAVDPRQAEDWTYGIEAYLRLDGYTDYATAVNDAGGPEFNAFIDAMTNQEGRTNMGRSSYVNLAAAHPAIAATAGLAPLPQTVPLPQTSTMASRFVYRQFRVSRATSRDMPGTSAPGLPAWQVLVADSKGGWQRVVPAALPPAVLDASAAVRSRIALFLVNGGWIAVPDGWQVLSAVQAVTPTWGVTFVAPGGARHGWLAVGGAGPGTSEVFSGSEGYFPGAYRLYDQVIPSVLTHDPTLSPTPDSLVHPDECTAVVNYVSGNLAVIGVKLLQPATQGIDLSPYVRSYFLALPKSDAALQAFLVGAFRKQHPVADCGNRLR